MPSKYPQSFRDRVVQMVTDLVEAEESLSRFQAIKQVAPKLNISTESLRRWVEQSEVAQGRSPACPPMRRLRSAGSNGRTPSYAGRTRFSRPRQRFSPRSSTAPRRNDRLHRHLPRSVRGRAVLPHMIWVAITPGTG